MMRRINTTGIARLILHENHKNWHKKGLEKVLLDIISVIIFVVALIIFFVVFTAMKDLDQSNLRASAAATNIQFDLLSFLKLDVSTRSVAQIIAEAKTRQDFDQVKSLVNAHFSEVYKEGWHVEIDYPSYIHSDVSEGYSFNSKKLKSGFFGTFGSIGKILAQLVTGSDEIFIINPPVEMTQQIPTSYGDVVSIKIQIWFIVTGS